jgi:3-hydroxybutyryl-CoA dehydrogenase
MVHYFPSLGGVGLIRTIAVVGANVAGRELAARAARAGYRTILEDLTGFQRNALAADPALQRVELASSLEEAAALADLILEAAPDDLESKAEVYTILDRVAPRPCIFAPTSPAWPVSEVASLTYRGPNVVGLWFEPGGIRVVGGVETSAQTLDAALEVARRL